MKSNLAELPRTMAGNNRVSTFDPIELEILWKRLISVVDEASAAFVRTCFSTLVRDGNDFAIVLTDAQGRSLAQSTALIKQTLQSQLTTAAQTAVDNTAKKNWLKKTECLKLYAMADCNGYKAPKTTSTATPGAATSAAGATAPASTGTAAAGAATTPAASGTATAAP